MGLGQRSYFQENSWTPGKGFFDTEHTLLLDNQWETSWSPAMHKSVHAQLVAVPNWGKGGWERMGQQAETGRRGKARRGSMVVAAALSESLHHGTALKIIQHIFWSSGK